jgi:hypothetical protein
MIKHFDLQRFFISDYAAVEKYSSSINYTKVFAKNNWNDV